MKTMHLQNPFRAAWILFFLACGLAACSSREEPSLKALYCISYSEIDTVCEKADLTEAGEAFLASQQNNLLLSHVVDRSIEMDQAELRDYDHLVVVNASWVERFGDPAMLSPVEWSDLSAEMGLFLTEQMPLWTKDGSVLPEGVHLCEYRNAELLALPPMVSYGVAPIYAKNPLLIVVEDPLDAMKAASYLLPLSSSGNLLFAEDAQVGQHWAQSPLKDYGRIYTVAENIERASH